MPLRALVVAGLLLVACAGPRAPEPPPAPPPPPRILAAADGAALDERELVGQLAAARFVLLGETHDNAEHHRLQARLLERLVLAGHAPAVAFEMIPADRQAALDAALEASEPTAEAIRAAVGWDESGWPAFELYAPIFEVALAAELPLVAADLSAGELQAVRRSDPELVRRLGLDAPLPPAIRAALERDLVASHCGHLGPDALPAVVRIQRARDARLAQSLLAASGGEERRAVLVTGAEHARVDRGVPRALARLAPGADVAAVGFLELPVAAPGALADSEALADRYGGPAPFDAVWLTEPAPREDPCVEFEEALRKIRR